MRSFLIDIGTRLEQCASASLVIVLARNHQRGGAALLGCVNSRPCLEHCESNTIMTVLAREHERCEALVLLGLEVGVCLEQCESDLLKAKEGWALACGSGWAERVLSLRFQ